MPTIKGSANFTDVSGTSMIIDADKYGSDGGLAYGATNVFFRQIRNLIIDTTDVPGTVYGIHWPSSQATTMQNVVFKLSEEPDNKHTGVFMEEGSGGFLGDLVFYGGQYGAQFGNQQYTTRNLTFVNCQTAIMQLWDWFWVYKDITIVNCDVGINIKAPTTGSVVLLDSFFFNTSLGIVNERDVSDPGTMPGEGTLVLENVGFSKVDMIYQGVNATLSGAQGSNSTFINGKILVSNPAGVEAMSMTDRMIGQCVHT